VPRPLLLRLIGVVGRQLSVRWLRAARRMNRGAKLSQYPVPSSTLVERFQPDLVWLGRYSGLKPPTLIRLFTEGGTDRFYAPS